METSLHRDLKALYARKGSRMEVPLGRYRIDVVSGKQLVEIQAASLAAIRDKVRELLEDHRVLVVKPIVAEKRLVKRAEQDGPVVERRMSPKRGQLLDAFHELIYFTRVFPHRRLTLDLLLVDIEEWRYPGHGRRRRWRRQDHVVEDQKLVAIRQSYRLRTAHDLAGLISCPLPRRSIPEIGRFARHRDLGCPRIAYCLRKMGANKKWENKEKYDTTSSQTHRDKPRPELIAKCSESCHRRGAAGRSEASVALSPHTTGLECHPCVGLLLGGTHFLDTFPSLTC